MGETACSRTIEQTRILTLAAVSVRLAHGGRDEGRDTGAPVGTKLGARGRIEHTGDTDDDTPRSVIGCWNDELVTEQNVAQPKSGRGVLPHVSQPDGRSVPADTYSIVVGDSSMRLADHPPRLAKLVAVPDEIGKQLAHMGLHGIDLQKAIEYLDELDRRGYPQALETADYALWHSALIAMYKCFGNSKARSRLNPDDIYTDAAQRKTFDYWRDLRNKNIVHDENDVTQGWVVAVLRQPGYEPKIDGLQQLSIDGVTVCAENSAALRGLVDTAKQWVRVEADRLKAKVLAELNAMTYEELDALPPPRVDTPTEASVSITRRSPPK